MEYNSTFFTNLGYPLLAQHWRTVALWAMLFAVADRASSFILQPLLTRQKLSEISRRSRVNWGSHCISQFHSVVVVYFSFVAMRAPVITDFVHGVDPRIITLANFSLGFFVYDLVQCILEFELYGITFTVHALLGLNFLLFAYIPKLVYFIPIFLTFEFSTIFLNSFWFCDKLGLTGSWLQMTSGIGLVVSFALVRVVFGSYKFYGAVKILLGNSVVLGPYVTYSAIISIILSWLLNAFWLYKIINAFTKRFDSSSQQPDQTKKVQ